MVHPAHVIVIPVPAHGHINPMLHLSMKLVSMGITVSFITSATHYDQVLQLVCNSGVDQEAVSANLHILSVSSEEDDFKPLVADVDLVLWPILGFLQRKTCEIDKLIHSSVEQHGPACCLILDLLCNRVLSLECRIKGGIPEAIFWTSSAAFLHLSLHLRMLVDKGYVPLKTSADEEVGTNLDASIVPGITDLTVENDIPYAWQEEPVFDPGFKLISTTRETTLGASYVLMNTFWELEEDALLAMQRLGVKVFAVGPLNVQNPRRIPRPADEFDQLFEWLNSKPASSVIYASFGTFSGMNRSDQIREVADGLEESGRFFVWNLGKELISKLPDGFEKRIHEKQQGLICTWCPQLLVLRHSAVGMFMTHCGWNSTLESLSSGVAMLGWPCMAEQNLTAKYLADVWKAGSRVHANRKSALGKLLISRETITTAIENVMGSQGAEMRERAREWGAAARKAVGTDGPSTKTLEDFARQISALL